MIKLSIIIPAYNAEPYIDELINSLKPQITDEVEVLVVDDGSRQPYLAPYDFVKVFRKENGGCSTARNIKQLLEDKEINLQIPPRNARQRFEQKELLRIYDMLKPTGLIKAKVKVRGKEYGTEA